MERQTPYLSICAMYRDEAPYLAEWLEFHRLVGVERFFLYDNGSVDDHRELLAPYIADAVVTLYDWPFSPASNRYLPEGGSDTRPAQFLAYDHCLNEHRHDSRWIAFLDLDEFLFSPTGKPVSEILTEYEAAPGVGVHWAVFGTSGHRMKPPGLVIESYLHRTNSFKNQTIKSVVDPARTLRCMTAHAFVYDNGLAVNEKHEPIDAPYGAWYPVSFSRLRINHYWTKSEEEWKSKVLRDSTAGAPEGVRWLELREKLEQEGMDDLYAELNEERDETITSYVPAVREALARVR